MKTRTKILAAVLAATLLFGACDSTRKSTAGRKNEERTTQQIQLDMQKATPIPKFAHSQLRENLKDIITAQAKATQTTSFFFNQGVSQPVSSCPSIGFPIPSTAQLTNPDQKIKSHDITLPQMEPTGIYSGDSTGTYVICIDATGGTYATYWEGFVQTVTGPAEWKDGTVSLIGPSSFDFDTGK
jgi:hypothetical protein